MSDRSWTSVHVCVKKKSIHKYIYIYVQFFNTKVQTNKQANTEGHLLWGRALLISPGLVGAASLVYTTTSRSTGTKATSEQTVSERLLSQRSTATIPHNQFAHVLLGNRLAARSSSFLLAPQEKKKPESSQTNWLSAKQVLTPLLISTVAKQQHRLYYFTWSEVRVAVNWLVRLSLALCVSITIWKFFFLPHWHHFRSNNGSIKKMKFSKSHFVTLHLHTVHLTGESYNCYSHMTKHRALPFLLA